MPDRNGQVQILVHPSPDAVAEAIAARLIARVGELQDHRAAVPQLCLTGGRIATKAYQHLADDGPRQKSTEPHFAWLGKDFPTTP